MHKSFEDGRWGGEIRREFEPQPGDIVALEHWCSSGFANTDLDVQLKSTASISLSSSASWPTRAWSPPYAVTVQVVTTGITPQLATSERLREAETEPRHHVGPRHTPR